MAVSRLPAIGLTAKEATLTHDMLGFAITELEAALTLAHKRHSDAAVCILYRERLQQSRNLLARLKEDR